MIEETFTDVIGQELAVQLLNSALLKKHLANAYLFSGPDGVGKRLTAIRFLEALINLDSPGTFIRKRIENRNHPDLLWIEPTYLHQGNLITQSNAKKEGHSFKTLPQIRLEQIKNIKQFLGRKPVESKFGIVLIENLENINESASNGLLKTLEEPNQGMFVLLTERVEALISTIRSRCQLIHFNRLSNVSLKKVLNEKLTNRKEELEIGFKEKELLALSNGSPGSILKNIEIWQKIPKELWPKIKDINSNNPVDALSTAKDITEILDSQQQLWLIGWIQQYIWIKNKNSTSIKILEKLKFHIKSFVNTRLAWEIALLQLHQFN
tara:strand:- start:729 stop:1697 length:969 start_codon:yes stop_codon:yes gene_type:complete